MQRWAMRARQWFLGYRWNWRQTSRLVRVLWAIGAVLFLLSNVMPSFLDEKLGPAWHAVLLFSGLLLYGLGVHLKTRHLVFSKFDLNLIWAGFGLLGLLLLYSAYQLLFAYALA